LNYELLIARKIVSSRKDSSSISKPIVRIAVAGVAIGFAVMIVAIAIVTGFKKQIREKVIGFGSHIQISNYDENNSYETKPVSKNDTFINYLSSLNGIRHVEEFATKAGIIKTKTDIEGVVVKGVGRDYNWDYFQKRLTAGHIFIPSDTGKTNDVIISRLTADRLRLKVNDDLITYFIQQPPRARKFHISGIYETGLEEFDSKYIFCDIAHIRQLNDWNQDQTGGYEVTVSDFNDLDKTGELVYSSIPADLNSRTIREMYPQIFDWLGLQDVNGIVIIVLMLIVSVMNMISALLIIILERVQMIGTLKSLGASNFSVQKIFLYESVILIGKGLLLGNIIGIGLCLVQYYTHFIQLDQQSYYISFIPIFLSPQYILMLNAGTFAVCVVMMMLPTIIVTKITPLQALRFS
jgi:lipoprotein-releasing system permease protein